MSAEDLADVVQIQQYMDLVNPQGGGVYIGYLKDGWEQKYASSPKDAIQIIQQVEANEPKGVFVSQATFKSVVSREAYNADTLAGLFLDLDTGSDAKKKYPTMEQAAAALTQLQKDFLPASATVCSGGGYHAYWTFDSPISAQDWKPIAEKFKTILLADKVTIDKAVPADAARVLRVPGTVNRKHGKSPCRFISRDPDRKYLVSTIRLALDTYAARAAAKAHQPLAHPDASNHILQGSPPFAAGVSSVAAALAGSSSWGIEPTAVGGRNTALCSLLGHAYAKGHTPDTFRITATEWNSRCQPPMDTDEVERTLLSMWKTHLSHHPDAGVAAARREAQRKENAEIGTGEQFCPQPEVLKTEDMLGRFIFLSDGSRVFDTKYPKHVLSLADFRNTFAASCSSVPTGAFSTTGTAKTKSVPNFKAWLDSPQRLSAYSTTFDASASVYAKDPNGRKCVNMWTGFDRSIDPGAADVSFILEQIRWLFKDRANDFLDWLAHIEQHPGVLPHTMWLHISSYTGTGRNAIARLLSRVFSGYAAMSLALERVLDSGFNDELASKVLAVVDEIRIGGKDQWRHSETLKQMITAQVRHINVKYGRKSVEANACRFLVFSNHRNALPIDDNDRRIEVVISDARPKDAAHYSKLYRDVDDIKVVAAFAQFLRERDLSLFTPGRHALKNADKAQVVAVTGSDEYSALMEFTEIYTPPLVTAERLARVAGLLPYSSDARRFKFAAMDAGWLKVGRPSVKGKRVVIYAKKETVAQWINKKNEFLSGLPECDGGTVIWDEKND